MCWMTWRKVRMRVPRNAEKRVCELPITDVLDAYTIQGDPAKIVKSGRIISTALWELSRRARSLAIQTSGMQE